MHANVQVTCLSLFVHALSATTVYNSYPRPHVPSFVHDCVNLGESLLQIDHRSNPYVQCVRSQPLACLC